MNTIRSFRFIAPIALVSVFLFFLGCSDDNSSDTPTTDDGTTTSFDREAMLTNWADNIIIPAYQAFSTSVDALKTNSDAFESDANETTLAGLREVWEDAYIAWQDVAMFQVGPAEDEFLRNFLNTYPLDVTGVMDGIATGTYNFMGSNSFDLQGFPALDYLLYGLADTDAALLEFYTSNGNATNYLNYLTDVVDRIKSLTDGVVADWEGDYRDDFVANSGSSASSSTNRLVNDYILYYERNFRDGKVGIPAGIRSEGTPQPERVEAFYRKDLSKVLFNEALDAVQGFFRGTQFNGTNTGESLESYLDFLNTMKDGEDLSSLINNQFDASRTAAASLTDSFYAQINSDNTAMVNTFDALQANVVFLKSDMTSALSIAIDFSDIDGD